MLYSIIAVTSSKAAAASKPHATAHDSQSKKFSLDKNLSDQAHPAEQAGRLGNIRNDYLEDKRSQKNIGGIAEIISPVSKFTTQVVSNLLNCANDKAALNRNNLALALYAKLHGKMRYKLGTQNITPQGQGDCTSFDEYVATQFGHTDQSKERWNTRTLWQSGYGMSQISPNAIFPGDMIVVPPRGKLWAQTSKSEPSGVGHAGIIVNCNGSIKIMHASSIFNTVILSTPEEFMDQRLGFKIFRPQGTGDFAVINRDLKKTP